MQDTKTPKSIWTNPIHFIAFGFGSGALPKAPGTFGTIIAIPLYLLIDDFSLLAYLLFTLAALIAGIWICDKTAKDIGVHDHPGIVWDEIVGYLVTMINAPKGWQWVLLGFFLFRVFDILKPPPINLLETRLKGGLAIMADDVGAGLVAMVIIQILTMLIA